MAEADIDLDTHHRSRRGGRSSARGLGRRLVGLHGRFGLLLATGDVLRITSIGAANISSDGLVLLDVSLDHSGVPDGIDLAWQPKQFLGAPVPGATAATVNLAHVVAALEFTDTVLVKPPGETDALTADAVVMEMGRVTAEVSEQGERLDQGEELGKPARPAPGPVCCA